MISISELKHHLKITGTDDDTYLADLEASAVAFMERQTGQFFGTAAVRTEYVLGNDTANLWLSAEASAVTSVHEAAYPGAALTEITTAADDGFLVRGSRLVRKGDGGVWTRGYEYTVVYTAGYSPGAQPEDVKGAVRDLVTLAYKTRGGMKSETIGGYRYDVADIESVPGLQQTIDAHRAPVIA